MSIWGEGCRAPYEYAADIERMRTREERAAALAVVPEHLRDMVRSQVISDLTVINDWARRVADGWPRERVPAMVLAAAEVLNIKL